MTEKIGKGTERTGRGEEKDEEKTSKGIKDTGVKNEGTICSRGHFVLCSQDNG